jgi:predicted DNA-binding transcriptional regulator AlpA
MKNKLMISLTAQEFRDLLLEAMNMINVHESFKKPDNTSESNVISRLEVAKLFGVSKTTIDKWRRSKILPPIVKIASRVYFRRDQIIDLLQRKQRILDSFNLKSHDHE